MLTVCIFSSVHPRYDTRIFIKQAVSLYCAGFNVTFVVADGKGDEVKKGIQIVDVGVGRFGRIGRITLTALAVYKKVKRVNADVYHFHDPELIPIGLLLRMFGKKVVYDVHEDLPRQTMAKHYLPQYLRKPISRIIEIVENIASLFFSAICTATPHICERFKKINEKTIDINNYPILTEFGCSDLQWKDRQNKICYVGVISEIRGIVELVDAMDVLDCELDLAGSFSPASLRDKLIDKSGWLKVNELGFVDRGRVKSILTTSQVGIVTLHPTINYLDSLPVKMFEYMAAGIPVIASDFPLWKKIIEDHNCGICVDPESPKSIVKAVNKLLHNKILSAGLGANGRKAVENKFNWRNEEKKMIKLYQELI